MMSDDNRFVSLLHRFIKDGCFSRQDVALSLAHPTLPFRRHAPEIVRAFTDMRSHLIEAPAHTERMVVDAYQGRNRHVLKMQTYLNCFLKDDLLGSYVHGSLGVSEEITFSDFDALVILRDEVFDSPDRLVNTALKLYKALHIMVDFDPLQHHGWFVLAESQLRAYPEHYFPTALLPYARSLFSHSGLEFDIALAPGRPVGWVALDNTCMSIISRIEEKKFPSDLYELKFLMSQFMLLPALYLQDVEGQGTFKKHSFERAASDFPEEIWQIMDDVSEIRGHWTYKMFPLQRILAVQSPLPYRRLTRRLWAPAIPPNISILLTPHFYERMVQLARLMVDTARGKRDTENKMRSTEDRSSKRANGEPMEV